MTSCDFEEIITSKNLEIENGVLGLERDVYLSIIKILDLHCKKSLSKYFCLVFIPFCDSTLELVKNLLNE
jgi:hypothetical protein